MKLFLCALVVLSLSTFSVFPSLLSGAEPKNPPGASTGVPAADKAPTYPSMPGPGKKVPMEGGYYLTYGFDKKPKLGTVIMKVEIFTADGKKTTSVEAKADAGMPSMKGAHETGEKTFAVSKKGDYLLPINIVMPGDWEVRLSILKDGKVIFRGRYNFDV
ncbi:MAG TPA: hypothetical protein VMT71_04650 [Syntrophorhabdales bacterium]|nr:hypothetical protein [Syntrophorhabdales bacterium]